MCLKNLEIWLTREARNCSTFETMTIFWSATTSVNFEVCHLQLSENQFPLHLFQIRPSTDQESFLIHPLGLLYSEVTASSLLKINPDGSVVDQGSTNLGVNKAGILLHSSIHGARKDARAVLHLHQEDVVAVSFITFTRQGFFVFSSRASHYFLDFLSTVWDFLQWSN